MYLKNKKLTEILCVTISISTGVYSIVGSDHLIVIPLKWGKTQVYDAIKIKEKIMSEWVNGKNWGKNKRLKSPLFERIDKKL